MHISEGFLSGPVLAGGAAIAVGGLGVSLWRLRSREIPRVGLLTALLFVVALVHVQIGPSSAHLLGIGLAGVLLGWAVFPAVAVAGLLQAVLFSFGGLTTLGVNTACFGLAGLICRTLVGWALRRWGDRPGVAAACGAIAGAVGVAVACVLISLALLGSDAGWQAVVWSLLAAHLPIMGVEAIVTASILATISRVRPDLLMPPSPMQPPIGD